MQHALHMPASCLACRVGGPDRRQPKVEGGTTLVCVCVPAAWWHGVTCLSNVYPSAISSDVLHLYVAGVQREHSVREPLSWTMHCSCRVCQQHVGSQLPTFHMCLACVAGVQREHREAQGGLQSEGGA